MKKHIFAILTTIFMLYTFAPVVKAQTLQPRVTIGNENFECIISDGHTYIPMRAVFETLGYTVDWDGENKAVILAKDNQTLTLYTKTNIVTGYGELENKVMIVDSRTYLPFRELLNILGYQVDWLADSKTAVVLLPETTTETTTEVTTETTTEATTETITYDTDLYIGDTKVTSKDELVDAIWENIKNQPRPDVSELTSLIPEN